MAPHNPRKSATAVPLFPYQIIWESYPGGVVKIEDLEWKEDQYETLNSPGFGEHFGAFIYDANQLAALVKALGLKVAEEEILHRSLRLIAGFYLAPERQLALGIDRFTSIDLLRKIARSANELVAHLERLPPILAGAMHYTMSGEELADRPDAPNPFELTELVRGLANVAAQHAEGVGQQRTGPRGNFVRDTMLTLTMQALLDAGLGYPGTSDGTKAQSGKHLTRPAGVFMRQFLVLIAPKLEGRAIVPLIRQLRPAMRSAQIRRESDL